MASSGPPPTHDSSSHPSRSGFGASYFCAPSWSHYDPGASCWCFSLAFHIKISDQMAPPWKTSLWPQSKVPLLSHLCMLSYCLRGICGCPELSRLCICFLIYLLLPSPGTRALGYQGFCVVQCLLTIASGAQSWDEGSSLPIQWGYSAEGYLLFSYLHKWWHLLSPSFEKCNSTINRCWWEG